MSVDALKKSITGFINGLLAPIDYFALYSSKVVQQDADLSLQVTPDDPRLPGMSKVPINLGIPGATAKVQAGARALLGFANGDPSKPRAFLWESATLTELTIGGTPNDFVALAGKVLTELQKIQGKFDAHTHLAGALVAPSGGGPVTGVSGGLSPGQSVGSIPSVAATTVKVK